MNASPARNFQHIMEEMGPAPANTEQDHIPHYKCDSDVEQNHRIVFILNLQHTKTRTKSSEAARAAGSGPTETGGPWNRSHSQLRSS